MKFKVSCVNINEPIVYYFFQGGHITSQVLIEIEEELLLQLEEEIEEAFRKSEDLIIEVDYTEGETQYGSGVGNVYTVPDYWHLNVVGSEAWRI